MNPDKVRKNHQTTCTGEKDIPGEIQTQKESLQRVEARTGSLGEMQRNCPGREESDLNMAWDVKDNKNSFSRYSGKKRKTSENVSSTCKGYHMLGYSGYGDG